ncbi:MAG TPA: hypothetical protein VG826_09415 [Pirellulales bacterium]|nr:hypothetical protein [Pirellulales bacterium]
MTDPRDVSPDAQAVIDELLGYLNLSAGTADVRFQSNLIALAGWLRSQAGQPPLWEAARLALLNRLAVVRGQSTAFSDTEQADAVVAIAFDLAPKAYLGFHRDLLWHQTADNLFRPFFLARVCEAVLQQGPPWSETARIVEATVKQLNSFIGHRPIAVLRTPQHVEPYANEWVAAVPLYLRGVGVSPGKYSELIAAAIGILEATDADILEEAHFSPGLLDELAFDPRAYDFDHPVNKRPNYQFGQWDPHRLDSQGRYRRFVVQEITLGALEQRIDSPGSLPREEALFEAAAVLAGTILMASGVSGRSPDTHDSTVTLAKLVPRIAAYRDEFYRRLLAGLPGPHGDRLRQEAAAQHQPLAAARQHLNQFLARLRAAQLQHVHLAQIFARMGYPQASTRQAEIVAVPSARLLCEISGRLTAGHHALDRRQPAEAADLLPGIEDLLTRAVQCGALVDPWNILGFQGQFSLFPAIENSVRDHRVDVLIQVVRQIFGLYARTWGDLAALGDAARCEQLSAGFKKLAHWWDRFATVEVGGVEHVSGREAHQSAAHVAQSLAAWRTGGAAAGNIAFWRDQVENFDSAKAYALVVAPLLDQADLTASMALLMQWVARSQEVPLTDGDHSFQSLALRWFALAGRAEPGPGASSVNGWPLAKKFLDYLEANAEAYWEVPEFDLAAGRNRSADSESPAAADGPAGDSLTDEGTGDENLFRAAYDEMTYRDSTDDGFDADMLEGRGGATDFELDAEAERIGQRLEFLLMVARLWKRACGQAMRAPASDEKDETLRIWCGRAADNRRRLSELLSAVHRFSLPRPIGTQESLVEYDRRRMVKETLLAKIVIATVETSSAELWLSASVEAAFPHESPDWKRSAADVLRPMFRGRVEEVREAFPRLLAALGDQPILYVPLSRQGDPMQIVSAKMIQQLLHTLLRGLVRLGLLCQTGQLIAAAQSMEHRRPAGEGAVTEFDRLFEVGFRGIAETLVTVAAESNRQAEAAGREAEVSDAELTDVLQAATEPLLKRWLAHSRTLRLSVIERLSDQDRWESVKTFVERYGREIFTPRFMNLGNLRGILHRGVDAHLKQIEDDPELADEWPLFGDLDRTIPRSSAIEQLTLVIESIVENYAEFKDFNSTTTQSDRGDLLHVLLDLLRLKMSYERVAWNIKPVVVVHDALARRGWPSAAELWRRGLAQRTAHIADWHLKRLADLNKKYGIRLPTIGDRLAERFVRPLAIDRIRALVCPAIEDARRGRKGDWFALLEQELTEFTDNPSGSGLDVPAWLIALEEEESRCEREDEQGRESADLEPPVPRLPLTWDEVQGQVSKEE